MGQGRFDDDADMLQGCREGDEAAWSALVAKYGDLILTAARNRLRQYGFSIPRQDLSDIRQDILAAIWEERLFDEVRNAGSLKYWLAIVAGNAALQHMRVRRHTECGRTLSLFDRIGEHNRIDLIPASGCHPADDLRKKEASKLLDAAIEDLPAREKLIIKLNLLHDKPYDEIAGMLGIPIGTVSSHIKRAKDRLRRSLKDLF